LKRAHLRRVKSVESSPGQVESSVEQYEVSNGVKRKKRTSAAMIGLALSMGASSLLIPRQNEGAKAAEPTPADTATISMVPSTSAAPAASMLEHQVTKGQTLWKLSQQYQVSVDAIAAANSLKATDILKVGQVVRIPTAASAAQSVDSTKAPQLVASADLSRLPVAAAQVETTQAERNASLAQLRQQQEKLRQSLAGLKTKDQAAKTDGTSSSEAAQATSEPSPIAARPPQAAAQARSGETATTARSAGSTQDWLRTNQALTAPQTAAPRLISQVPSPAAATSAKPSTVRPAVQQIAANPATEMVPYQVGLGDTVAIIARAHNISPSTLVQANRISDPNFIFVGQILRVPAVQATSANNPAPRARQTAPAQPVATRLTVVPTTVSAAPTAQPSWSGATPSTSGLDPHVENLLTEIKVMRERHRAAAPAAAINVPAPEAVRTPSSLPTLSVSTQFNPGGLNAVEAPQPRSARSQSQAAVPIRVPAAESRPAAQPQQVAAAPAGSESYAPLLQPVTGRTVSPDLPPLQGEDNFLPEGTPSFNGYIWPSKGLLTSGYGWRWGRMHAGIDIAADVGTPVMAAADGVVEYSDWNSGGYGNLVEIRHADGSMTRYGHLNRSLVQVGQKVKQGEQIAEMGSTGYSTGPHLHFEVHTASDGGSVDPISYLPQQ
jgi:murein DD-endopeptidase MepM/ murein hydrolase activator NlpD